MGKLRSCALAALVGFGLVVWVDWPGLLSTDSVRQLTQALSGHFSDSQPPLMAWIWSWMLGLKPGLGGLLFIQNALFWSADAVLWAELGPARLAWVGVIASGLFPPVFALLGMVWKDVQASSALLAALALLILAQRGRVGRWSLPAALLLLFYAAAVRFNGILAVAPLLWLWTRARFRLGRGWQGAATAGLALCLFGCAWALERSLVTQEDHLSQQYELHDVVGLSVDTGTNLLPEAYWGSDRKLTLEEMKATYDPIEPSSLYWPYGDQAHFELITNPRGTPPPERLAVLQGEWLRLLWRFRARLLSQRLLLMSHMFGLRPQYVCYDYITEMHPNPFGVALAHPRAQAWASKVLAHFRHGLLYRGWLYLLLLIGAAAFAQTSRSRFFRRSSLAVAASGIGSVLVYPIIGAGCDFRYLWWLMISALLCSFLAIAGRGVADDALA
jgi:hypothetical protein